jgi:hypothetical protein
LAANVKKTLMGEGRELTRFFCTTDLFENAWKRSSPRRREEMANSSSPKANPLLLARRSWAGDGMKGRVADLPYLLANPSVVVMCRSYHVPRLPKATRQSEEMLESPKLYVSLTKDLSLQTTSENSSLLVLS